MRDTAAEGYRLRPSHMRRNRQMNSGCQRSPLTLTVPKDDFSDLFPEKSSLDRGPGESRGGDRFSR